MLSVHTVRANIIIIITNKPDNVTQQMTDHKCLRGSFDALFGCWEYRFWTRRIGFGEIFVTREGLRGKVLEISKMPRTLNRRTKLYDKGTFSKNSSKFAYDAEESEALDSLATLSYDVVWLVNSNVLATSVPRHVPQYVHDSVSNASHLPAVNYLNPSF